MAISQRFLLLLEKSPSGGYWAMVPALPGCYSSGDTFDETMTSVQEAIVLHLEGMREDNQELLADGDFVVAHVDVEVKARL